MMLSIDSVTLDFGTRSVLAGCYLNCEKGEIVGLLGRNGSGKSCLLKVIFGILKPVYKHLRIDDRVVEKGNSHQQVAYLPQDTFLPPFSKLNSIIKSLEIDIQEHISGIDLIEENKDKRMDQLSGGMSRLIETIWILGQKASYILLDEPFSGLAPVHVEMLQSIIRKTAQRKGIIMTDHIYHPLLEISDRVVLLHNNSVYPIESDADLIRYNYIPDYQ